MQSVPASETLARCPAPRTRNRRMALKHPTLPSLRIVESRDGQIRRFMYTITRREAFSDTTFLWDVMAPDVARASQPGHFVMLRLHEGSERIPLTVADFDPRQGHRHAGDPGARQDDAGHARPLQGGRQLRRLRRPARLAAAREQGRARGAGRRRAGRRAGLPAAARRSRRRATAPPASSVSATRTSCSGKTSSAATATT